MDLCDSLCRYLRAVGFDIDGAPDAPSFWSQMAERPADIVILDINLPGESGFAVTAKLRATTRVGIVLLTARAPQQDKILGLSLGADHYLVKPVEPTELELVLRNLARRLTTAPAEASPEVEWTFDPRAWTLGVTGGKHFKLTAAELSILQCLLEHPGKPVPRGRLHTASAPLQDMPGRSVDTVIYRLRKRAESACGTSLPILAVRGIGYVFAARIAQTTG